MTALRLRSRSRARGFTLLEILLALALTGLLVVALNTFIFSMGALWGKQAPVHLFELHTRAVTRWLEGELRAAALPPAGRTDHASIFVKEIRPLSGSTENLITFETREGGRLLNWPEQRALPDVVCSLQVRDGKGLMLLWHSRVEKRFTDDAPREVLISPWVSGLSYDYYDTDGKRWQTETALRRSPDTSEMLVPQRLRIKFTYEGMTRDCFIVMPVTTEGLPNF